MALGTILRLAGYLLEIACLVGLFRSRTRPEQAPVLAVEGMLYLGILAGVGLIVAGNVVNARRPRDPDRWGVPRDSP